MEESVGYIVGDNGKIIQKDYNDSTWQDISIPDYFHLKDVTFNDYENGIVVGTKQVRIDGRTYYLPTIHITTNAGTSWIEKTFDIRGKLNSVSYFEEENIITVGDSGMVLLSNDLGNNWSYLNSNVNSNLYEVKYCPDGIGIIVGDSGTIIISDDGW